MKSYDHEQPHEKPVEYVQVLFTYNAADVAFIKSLLDGEGIAYYFLGEEFMYVRPWVEPARLMVDKKEADQVRELLKDANLSITAANRSGKKKED